MVKEIPLTQGRVTLVDDEDYERLSQFKWYCHVRMGKPYASRTIHEGSKSHVESMHRVILNVPKGQTGDHRNGDTLDNRRCNLRICSRRQNACNRKKRANPTSSRYKGVSWNKRRGKWHSRIFPNGMNLHLGYYDVEEEAAKAYDVAALHHYGEFARLNFPPTISKEEAWISTK